MVVRATKVTIGRAGLLAAVAALALSVAGLQSWAEGQTGEQPSAEGVQSDGPGSGANGRTEAAGEEADNGGEVAPEFAAETLDNPEVIATGEAVWQEQCRHCHGRSAYPGKAPKLRPSRYTPEFVYHRVTEGFRGMPAWKDVYSEEERVAVTAYVLSNKFSP